ncbi:hypothetical protein [Phenylobacterium sp.]|uniref:hypothetical protein n=1 Tax=Phenylobacterium sp. TaxID=1871053 RepID=UPI003D2B9AE0
MTFRTLALVTTVVASALLGLAIPVPRLKPAAEPVVVVSPANACGCGAHAPHGAPGGLAARHS